MNIMDTILLFHTATLCYYYGIYQFFESETQTSHLFASDAHNDCISIHHYSPFGWL